MSQTLDEDCTLSDDCSTITCKMNFVKEPITFKLKVSIVIFYKYPHNMLKVARYSFSRPIPPKFEHKLRRHKQSFGKIAKTVVLDKDENLL